MIRELFKLKLSELQQINFDAAIQIQWHVKDMIEAEQARTTFIAELGDTFIAQWKSHSRNKTERYTELVKTLKERLSDLS